MKENVLAQINVIRNELETAEASAGRSRSADRISALTKSMKIVCDLLEAMCQQETRAERIAAESATRTTYSELLGETPKSAAGFSFRVTRIVYASAPRVRVELLREDRVVRSLDSTDRAFRELGNILVKL